MARKALIEKCRKQKKFKARSYNRCMRCGRKRGFIRDFKLCRLCFREMANRGEIPGVKKASW